MHRVEFFRLLIESIIPAFENNSLRGDESGISRLKHAPFVGRANVIEALTKGFSGRSCKEVYSGLKKSADEIGDYGVEHGYVWADDLG